jgi:hypothetical protein
LVVSPFVPPSLPLALFSQTRGRNKRSVQKKLTDLS